MFVNAKDGQRQQSDHYRKHDWKYNKPARRLAIPAYWHKTRKLLPAQKLCVWAHHKSCRHYCERNKQANFCHRMLRTHFPSQVKSVAKAELEPHRAYQDQSEYPKPERFQHIFCIKSADGGISDLPWLRPFGFDISFILNLNQPPAKTLFAAKYHPINTEEIKDERGGKKVKA